MPLPSWRLVLLPLAVAFAAPPARAAVPPADASSFAAGDVDPPIALRGVIVDRAGRPIAGAKLEIRDFAAANPTIETSDSEGRFAVAGLARRSVLLRVTRPAGQDYYEEIIPINLQRPARTRAVNAGEIVLTTRTPGRARLIFVGDTMFGRRFADGDEDGVEGEAGDLIHPDTRAADAKRAVRFVRDALASADYTLANLECVVSDDLQTPHPYKAYLLASHPDTLAGLLDAGVDGVSAGNNHVFDYLGPGVSDTLDALAAAGLDVTGADMNESMARETAINLALGGLDLALQGMSVMRIDGSDAPKYRLTARDPAKAGALYASTENLRQFLDVEGAHGFAVPIIHGGTEYTRFPSDRMRRLFVEAVAGGAGLVVAHHPHVLQGIGLIDGADRRRFVLMSLGNFLFDQSSSETLESMIAVVDVEAAPGGGYEVHRIELIPAILDDYTPRLLAGEGLVRLGRRLGHLSTALPTHPGDSKAPDGLRGAVVFVSGHRVVALKNPSQFSITEADQSGQLPVLGQATPAFAYPRRGPADSLAGVHTSAPAELQLGRDVLLYGDFEDHDVDGEVGEAPGWELSASAFVQGAEIRQGARAAALRRTATDPGSSLVTSRRAPIVGGSALTIRGLVRGRGAGSLTVRARFFHETDYLGEVTVHTEPGGTHGWTRFSETITAPTGASGMHLSFRQGAPKRGTGLLFIDDVAVVQWERSVSLTPSGGGGLASIATPNDWGYLRFVDVAPGTATLAATLTHRTYALK